MTHATTRAAAALLLPIALLLTGCSMSSGTAGAADPGATSAANTDASAGADEAESDDSAAKDDGTATFGETYTYEDGLAVTVTKLKRFTPSEYAAAEKADHYVMFQITVKNGTKSTFDPTLFNDTLQDGEAEAESVFDSEKGLKGSPDTKLLPGRTVKWKTGYGVETSDLVMEVTPGFEYDSALFTP